MMRVREAAEVSANAERARALRDELAAIKAVAEAA